MEEFVNLHDRHTVILPSQGKIEQVNDGVGPTTQGFADFNAMLDQGSLVVHQSIPCNDGYDPKIDDAVVNEMSMKKFDGGFNSSNNDFNVVLVKNDDVVGANSPSTSFYDLNIPHKDSSADGGEKNDFNYLQRDFNDHLHHDVNRGEKIFNESMFFNVSPTSENLTGVVGVDPHIFNGGDVGQHLHTTVGIGGEVSSEDVVTLSSPVSAFRVSDMVTSTQRPAADPVAGHPCPQDLVDGNLDSGNLGFQDTKMNNDDQPDNNMFPHINNMDPVEDDCSSDDDETHDSSLNNERNLYDIFDEHGDEIISDQDAYDNDPGGIGAGMPIPREVPAQPGFLLRFSTRFSDLLKQPNPNFTEFCAVADDLTIAMKK